MASIPCNMTNFISRLFNGSRRANAVRTTYEYQVALELEHVERVFSDDVTTDQGKKARLQALGLFKRPISYVGTAPGVNRSDECLAVVWRCYKGEIFRDRMTDTALTDAQAETRLNLELQTYAVEGGTLPAAGTFGRLRIPGDFPVFYRAGDPEHDNVGQPQHQPEFTLAAGNRYLVEQKFYDDNPGLGKIPVVARVQRRVRGSNAAWAAAPANTRVYFQLVKPDNPPRFNNYSGNHTLVAGARSYLDQAVSPPLRGAYNVRSPSQSPANPVGGGKNWGPQGYIRRFVRTYPPTKKNSDPQNGNTHWHLGGKYQMGQRAGNDDFKNVWDTRAAGTNTRENIFTLANFARFHDTFPATTPTDLTSATDRKRHKYAVYSETDAAGNAGVVFCPSRIGGDRYKLKAYVYENGHRYEAVTGTMVVWRTVRISRDIVAQAPANAGQLPVNLTAGLSPFYNQCQHGSIDFTVGKYCETCLLKEGACGDPKFSTYFTTELAKGYCELLLDEKAANPVSATSDEVADDIRNHVLPAIQNDDSINRINTYPGELLTIADGNTTNFNHQLHMTNVEVGTASLNIGSATIAENPAGAFPADPASNLTAGTIDPATGQVTLQFGTAPPDGTRISMSYIGLRQIDFYKLLYFPPQAPFLFNLRTPEDYNAQLAANPPPQGQPVFPPIPVSLRNHLVLGTPDGVMHTFNGNYFPNQNSSNLQGIRLCLNGVEIGKATGDTNIGWARTEEVVGRTDGVQSAYNVQISLRNLAKPGTATVRIGTKAIDENPNSPGNFPADPAMNLTAGTINHATGQIALQFSEPPETDKDIKVQVDYDTLYFGRIDERTGAAQVVFRREHTEDVGVGDGNTTRFTKVLTHSPLRPLGGFDPVVRVNIDGKLKGALAFGDKPRIYQPPLTGGVVALDDATRTVTINFGTAPAAGTRISVTYSERAPCPVGGDLELRGSIDNPALTSVNGLTARPVPFKPYATSILDIVNNHLLIQLVRAISNNQGYMPGLICIRAPLRDTWQQLYQLLTLEGKGLGNGFFVFLGHSLTPAGGGRNPYETVALHELCHTLYFNHYESGGASGPRADLHDMWDNCMMGYAQCDHDLCGQCAANYMGMNVLDPRMLTRDATGYLEPDHGTKFGTAITG